MSELVCVKPPTNSQDHVEWGPQLRISSDRLEELGIELRTPGYKASGLSLHHERSINPAGNYSV